MAWTMVRASGPSRAGIDVSRTPGRSDRAVLASPGMAVAISRALAGHRRGTQVANLPWVVCSNWSRASTSTITRRVRAAWPSRDERRASTSSGLAVSARSGLTFRCAASSSTQRRSIDSGEAARGPAPAAWARTRASSFAKRAPSARRSSDSRSSSSVAEPVRAWCSTPNRALLPEPASPVTHQPQGPSSLGGERMKVSRSASSGPRPTKSRARSSAKSARASRSASCQVGSAGGGDAAISACSSAQMSSATCRPRPSSPVRWAPSQPAP